MTTYRLMNTWVTQRGRAHVLMHATVLVWGFTAILGRLISLHAVPLVFYRLVVVVLTMPLVILWRRIPFRIGYRDARSFAIIGTFVALHWMLFYACIKHAGVAVAVLCLSSITFFTALLEPIVFRRRASVRELVVGFGVMIGVSFLVRLEAKADLLGLAQGLGSAFFAAVFGSVNGHLARRHRGEVMSFYELTAALVVTGLFLVAKFDVLVPPSSLSLRDIGLLICLAIGCTVVPWLTSLHVLRTLTPYAMALTGSLQPIYSIILAYLLFDDARDLTWRFYAGGGILLALVAWTTSRRRS
ncbi:MAG: DMT family transporter [Labilithrix sp.]